MKNEANNKPGKEKENLPGYPHYAPGEDIYNVDKEEKELNPEDPSKIKDPNAETEDLNEKDFAEDVSGEDLDVPGAELDDKEEAIGNEDEENNLYSLGGDNHDSR